MRTVSVLVAIVVNVVPVTVRHLCITDVSNAVAEDSPPTEDYVRRIELRFSGLHNLKLPKADELEEMQIESIVPGVKEVPRFVVPRHHYQTILDAFGEPELMTHYVGIGYTEYGCVRLKLKTQVTQIFHVPWYWTEKGQLVYSLHGVQCSRKVSDDEQIVGSEAARLSIKVRNIWLEVTKQEVPVRLEN